MLALEVPLEPTSAKDSMKRGLEAHRELEIANIKQGTWVASPLWKDAGWRRELKKHGLTWQKFMILVRDHYPYFLDWVNGKAEWDYVIGKLIEHIEDELDAMKG